MKNKAFVVAKTNFRNIKLAYAITLITMGCILIQDIVYIILSFFNIFPGTDNSTLGCVNYLYLIIILGAIFIPSLNFRKIMNLGGKRKDFFWGCAVNYIIMAAVISLANLIFYYTYEKFIFSNYYKGGFTLNPVYWFGWVDNGPALAFFQQFAFLLFAAVFIHTLTAVQDKWYGWVADIVIIAIISVFTPIAPLRAALIWFFYMIIFSNAFVQIASCLFLSAAIYALNKFIFTRKAI